MTAEEIDKLKVKNHSHVFYDAECAVCVRKGYFEARRIAEGQVWTTEYPTQPGHYWIRNYVVDHRSHHGPTIPGPEIVNVDDYLDYITWTGDEMGVYRKNLVCAEWYGPIQPPAEQETEK